MTGQAPGASVETAGHGRFSRRARIVGGLVAALIVAGTGAALALPVSQYQSGYSSQQTCLGWYDYEGPQQGSISLCGYASTSSYGDYRNVQAQRSVRTCDANGQACTDAYSESYSGPASSTEFSMDAIAGTASFNITLAGEHSPCVVQATAQATDTYQPGGDPYPTVHAHADPQYPYATVWQGDTSYTASAWADPAYPTYAYGSVRQDKNSDVYRSASGSGNVCNWIETQSAGYGNMWANENTSTTYHVSPTAVP